MSENKNALFSASVGFICPMDCELRAVTSLFSDVIEVVFGGVRFLCGKIAEIPVVAAKCGVGKVFAAICAQTMILRYAPAVIVNNGVAGTLSSDLSIGQIALADCTVQHDMDTSPIGDPVGLISGINIIYIPTDSAVTAALAAAVESVGVPYKRGTVASGDQFICHTADKERICANFETEDKPVIACEMEGAAIGQVCYVNRVPYGILRAISDGGDEQAFADYPTFLAAAAGTATQVMLRFVENWA